MGVLTFLMSFAASRNSGCAVPCCCALSLMESMSCLKLVSPVMKLSLHTISQLVDAKRSKHSKLQVQGYSKAGGVSDGHPT